jgi:cation diffusion facilitator family transporter
MKTKDQAAFSGEAEDAGRESLRNAPIGRNFSCGAPGQASQIGTQGLLLNLFLTLFKYLAGYAGRSAAMIADATHSLSDLLTDVVVVLGFRFVQRPEDEGHDFGHGRIETVLALLCGVFLALVGAGIFWTAAVRLLEIRRGVLPAAPGGIALFAAVLSVVSKEWLYRYHTPLGPPPRQQRARGEGVGSSFGRRLSSVGTLVGIGGAFFLGEKWRLLDPLAALVVSVFVVRASLPILRESLHELTDGSLDDELETRITNVIRNTPLVTDCHALRTRRLGSYVALEAMFCRAASFHRGSPRRHRRNRGSPPPHVGRGEPREPSCGARTAGKRIRPVEGDASST